MSAPDINVFCQTLVKSKLFTEAEVADLQKRARADSGPTALAEGFAAWLVAQCKLTRYQADVLLRGHFRLLLGEYKLLEKIGSGRMAGVYRAIHKLGMPVAIKILPPSKAKQPDCLARFQREAQLALQLDHPNVIRTYHAGVVDDLHFIAMEYLDGETLEERLAEKGKLPPLDALRIAEQTLNGLQYLHDKSMVHRDLKPGNLMLLPAAAIQVKLLDIGLGRALFDEAGLPNADLTADGTLLGTPDYTAPEQTRNSHSADVRSDMYGLGCVLYHCLTGHVPFPEKNAVQKLMKHATQMPTPPSLAGYSEAAGLQAFLWKLLAKDPAMRFPTPADALRAIAPLLAIQVAAPVTPVAQPARPMPPPARPIAQATRPEAPTATRPATTQHLGKPAQALPSLASNRWIYVALGAMLVVAIVLLILLIAHGGD